MGSNGETVRAVYEAMAARDLDSIFANAPDDLRVDFSRSIGLQPDIRRGRAECERFYRSFAEAFEELRWDLHDISEPVPGVITVDVTFHARGSGSGVETTAAGGHLWLVEDGRPREWRLYQTIEEAGAAAIRIERSRRVAASGLYFVCEARPHGGSPRTLLEAAISGGAGLVQLRDHGLSHPELIAAAAEFRAAADAGGALFILNDRPDLVRACDADGVHVGQDDASILDARAAAGVEALVGLSTHSPSEIEAACAAEGESAPDQLSVGPVWETPTKAGRPGTGLELIEFAARTATIPWFAIGGIDTASAREVAAAGATRAVVVRAIRDADDPEAAARAITDALAAPARETARAGG